MSKADFTGGFRTSFAGYNKDDVNRYILAENEKFKKRLAEYTDRIEKLEAENAALKESADNTVIPEPASDIGVKVDEILSYAVKEAERILDEAKTAGLMAKEEISRNTELMKTEIQQRSDLIIESIKSKNAQSEFRRKPGRPPKKKENDV